MYWILIFLNVTNGIYGNTGSHLKLPNNIVPKMYTIEIMTDLSEKKFDFNGEETIEIVCTKSTDKIILHSKDLVISEKDVSINQQYKGRKIAVDIINQSYDEEKNFYIITVRTELVPGHVYFLFIRFKGNLNTDQVGYYKSAYYDSIKKKNTWLAVTQMGNIHARRVFPCFDQPDMKAVFQISMGHHKDLIAISNMPMTQCTLMMEKSDWVLDHFENSPPMSTYLVAFMVSDFQFKETKLEDSETIIRVWSQKELLEYADLAVNLVPKLISFYENFYRLPFPLPKLDMVAIPDFNCNHKAMETWGLNTFKSNWLLNYSNSDGTDKYSVVLLISIIVAYQWIGNLVTMKWWSDFWLLDGIINHVSMQGLHHLYPQLNFLEDEAISMFSLLMNKEQTEETFHSLSLPIVKSVDIERSRCDLFSNLKSSSLIRMIHMTFGDYIFRKSVSTFLNENKYSNAMPVDFWKIITEKAHEGGVLPSNLTVEMIMDSWIKQKGYPLLTITRDYIQKTVTITQQRYISKIQKEGTLPHNDLCWWVPLTYTNGNERRYNYIKPKAWLSCEGPLTINVNVGDDQWLLFNLKATGLLRVNYDRKNWNMLHNTLLDKDKYQNVNVLNRYQIIADSIQFAENGILDYEMFFKLMTYVKYETDERPWKFVLAELEKINVKLIRTATYQHFKKYMQDLLQPMFQSIGSITTIPENDEDNSFHALITRLSCHYGIEECTYQAKILLNQWFTQKNPDKNNPIPELIRDAVYCYGVESGSKKIWNFMWRRYEKENETLRKQQILCALGCTKNESLLKRFLEMSLDSSKINQENSQLVFEVVALNEVGYQKAKDFFMRKFKRILNSTSKKEKSNKLMRLSNFAKLFHFGKSQSSMLMQNRETYMTILAKAIILKKELDELQTFLSSMSYYTKENEKSLKDMLDIANDNIQWDSEHYDNVTRYFRSKWK